MGSREQFPMLWQAHRDAGVPWCRMQPGVDMHAVDRSTTLNRKLGHEALQISTLPVLPDVHAADRTGRDVCNLLIDRKMVLGWASVEHDRRDTGMIWS